MSEGEPKDAIKQQADVPALPHAEVLADSHGPGHDAAKGIGSVLDGLPGADTYTPDQGHRPPPGASPVAI